MKIANTEGQTQQQPPGIGRSSRTGERPAEIDALGESRNGEFLSFREAEGKLWVFPRAHLVSAEIQLKRVCEFDFRTHRVILAGDNCVEVYQHILDGTVCAVVSGPCAPGWPHARSVARVHVSADEARPKEGKS